MDKLTNDYRAVAVDRTHEGQRSATLFQFRGQGQGLGLIKLILNVMQPVASWSEMRPGILERDARLLERDARLLERDARLLERDARLLWNVM